MPATRSRPVRRPAIRRPVKQGLGEQLASYVELTRLNRPIGIFLLLWPTLWALWIAADGQPDPTIFVVFVLGVVVTRSAGCIFNDIADRHIDGEVLRTRQRPIASGRVSVGEALLLFAALGLIAIGLASMLNPLARWLAVGGGILLVVYPLTKRFLSVPQLILGAAFGWAIPMAFAASTGELNEITWLTFAIAVTWAIIYDTMYAMVDRDDDLNLGVKSTAILFGDADRFVIAGLQLVMLLGLILLGDRVGLGTWYFLGVGAAALFMLYEQWLIRDRDRGLCFDAFLNNHYVGMAVFIGIALDYLFRLPAPAG